MAVTKHLQQGVTVPSALQGLLLLYPARALIVRPYADSSKLSEDDLKNYDDLRKSQ